MNGISIEGSPKSMTGETGAGVIYPEVKFTHEFVESRLRSHHRLYGAHRVEPFLPCENCRKRWSQGYQAGYSARRRYEAKIHASAGHKWDDAQVSDQ